MKKIVILGASGFIGKHLASCLSWSTLDVNVVGIDINPSDFSSSNYFHMEADIRNEKSLEWCLGASKPDIIIHAAADVGVDKIKKNPNLCTENNLEITKTLMKVIDKLNLPKHLLVFFSSSEVYGNTLSANVEENNYNLFPERKRGSYAITKLLEENMLQNFYSDSKRQKCQLAIMRLFNIVGKGQSNDFVIGKMFNELGNGHSTLATQSMRTFCSVSFLAQCILQLANRYFNNLSDDFPKLCNFGSQRDENFISMHALAIEINKWLDEQGYKTGKIISGYFVKPEITVRKPGKTNIPKEYLLDTFDKSIDYIVSEVGYSLNKNFQKKGSE